MSKEEVVLMKSIVSLLLMLALAACSGKQQTWYNPGKTQADFDRVSQECEIIGREIGRQSTMTGTLDQEAYALAYTSCLNAKGWSSVPPTMAGGSIDTVPQEFFAEYRTDGTVSGFGESIHIPDGFRLARNTVGVSGATRQQNLFFEGPEDTFINLVYQKAEKTVFMATDFPVNSPFFLYETGAGEHDSDRLRWSLSAGKIGEDWVAVLGGYLLLGKHERITIVVTKGIPSQNDLPPEGLRITAEQRNAVEGFKSRWVEWLKEQD